MSEYTRPDYTDATINQLVLAAKYEVGSLAFSVDGKTFQALVNLERMVYELASRLGHKAPETSPPISANR